MMYINQTPISDFGAELEMGFTVSSTPIETQYLQGRNRTAYNIIAQQFGLKELKCTLNFTGTDLHEVEMRKSSLDALLWGKVELDMPDGFLYTSYLESAGTLEPIHLTRGRAEYVFKAICHGPLEQKSLPSGVDQLTCESTMPFTDCIVSGVTTAAAGSLAGFAFTNLVVGKAIEIDGINKRVLYDGAPYAEGFSFVSFPRLVPGLNTISMSGVQNVTVSFYPTFI